MENMHGDEISPNIFYSGQGSELYFTLDTPDGIVGINPLSKRFLISPSQTHLTEAQKSKGLVQVLNPAYLLPLDPEDVAQRLEIASLEKIFIEEYNLSQKTP